MKVNFLKKKINSGSVYESIKLINKTLYVNLYFLIHEFQFDTL